MNMRLACLYAAAPRAIAGRVHAQNPDTAAMVRQISANVEELKAKQNAELNNFQRAFDDLNARFGGMALNGPQSALMPNDPEYTRMFAAWSRHGDQEDELKKLNAMGNRATVHAAMSVGSDTAGGYLAPIEWDRRINKALAVESPMRRLARIVQTTVRAYSTLYQAGGWGSGWVGETANRPTTGTPTLASLQFKSGEIYSNPALTQQLLDDADFNIEQWLADELATEFAAQEAPAFLSGDGVNKPSGFLTYVTGGASDGVHPSGNLTVVNSGVANALPNADGLVDFVYGLPSPYRQNAKWLMNSMTAAAIAKFKDGNGNYLWRETYVAGQPATLLGYAVEIDEGMPSVGAGNMPIAFGDFAKGYVINDRTGVRILRDPYTNKPYVNFYTTKRVGGGVDDPKAIRLLKIST